MRRTLTPEEFRSQVKKGNPSPFYLFYGPDEFRMEREIIFARDQLIPGGARDFNFEVFYGDEGVSPGDVISKARSVPFMSKFRLIILRKIDAISIRALDSFLPYLDNPSESTCLIFVTEKEPKNKGIYQKIFNTGRAVHFRRLTEREIVKWIGDTAEEMGMKMNSQTCKYLFEIVGSNVRDIQSELEKLNLRFHKQTIGVDQIKEMAIHGRIYNVFELMDAISARDGKSATLILSRILDEEDERSSALKIMGMLNRQIRNLWKAMGVNRSGGKKGELSRITGLTNYYAEKLLHLSRKWTETELESAMALLYEADQLLKSGNRPRPVLEDLILALAFSGGGS